MKIPHEDFEAADCKEAAFTFCRQNHMKCKHFFRSLQEMISPTEVCWKCQETGGNCFPFEHPGRRFNLDIAECDAPCQPFSHLRNRDGGTPEDHAGYMVTFGEKDSLLAYHERIQAHWVLGEQVMAILRKTTADDSVSYPDTIMERLLAIKEPDTGKQKYVGHGSFFIEAREQSEVTRGRPGTLIFYVGPSKFGISDFQYIRSLLFLLSYTETTTTNHEKSMRESITSHDSQAV